MHWYFPVDMSSYSRDLATFVDAYLKSTLRKKRTILKHCKDIHFDFTKFVDGGFKTFLTNYLPLTTMLEFLIIFIVEGREGLYRFMYGLLKSQKEYIVSIKPEKDENGEMPLETEFVLHALEAQCKFHTDTQRLMEFALKGSMKNIQKY